MRAWVNFFLGTPQRFLYTLLGVSVIVVLAWPGLLRMAMERLVMELSPLLAPMLTIFVIFIGLRVMFGGRAKGGGGKN
jgi:hypothetical protein